MGAHAPSLVTVKSGDQYFQVVENFSRVCCTWSGSPVALMLCSGVNHPGLPCGQRACCMLPVY